MRKAIIAMSGGVDSSVAALLTKETGDECISFFTLTRKNNESICGNNHMYDGWSAGYGTAGV